jgi:hypothetical protein
MAVVFFSTLGEKLSQNHARLSLCNNVLPPFHPEYIGTWIKDKWKKVGEKKLERDRDRDRNVLGMEKCALGYKDNKK